MFINYEPKNYYPISEYIGKVIHIENIKKAASADKSLVTLNDEYKLYISTKYDEHSNNLSKFINRGIKKQPNVILYYIDRKNCNNYNIDKYLCSELGNIFV